MKWQKGFRKMMIPSGKDQLCIQTVDMHTGGEPLRILLDGYPNIHGESILQKRAYCSSHLDHIRKSLMWEPRGHADMYGCYITEPNDQGAAFGVIFMHNGGYSTMCGHATIALGRWAVDMGIVEVKEPVTAFHIDAPCGRLFIQTRVTKGKVSSISFECVPSFVLTQNQSIHIPEIGEVQFDIAYGGAFYAFVQASQLGLSLQKKDAQELITKGMLIKNAIKKSGLSISHPFEKDLGFLYGTIFIGESDSANADSRNVCIFADGELDRCPTGSGVSARMALHYSQGELNLGEKMRVESITGSIFEGYPKEATEFGPFQAVIPVVNGMAHYTGKHEFIIEQSDPFKEGFFIR
jgi:trans-L-3-hydroxyproline dehydratase